MTQYADLVITKNPIPTTEKKKPKKFLGYKGGGE